MTEDRVYLEYILQCIERIEVQDAPYATVANFS
jgi:hypothetical protein